MLKNIFTFKNENNLQYNSDNPESISIKTFREIYQPNYIKFFLTAIGTTSIVKTFISSFYNENIYLIIDNPTNSIMIRYFMKSVISHQFLNKDYERFKNQNRPFRLLYKDFLVDFLIGFTTACVIRVSYDIIDKVPFSEMTNIYTFRKEFLINVTSGLTFASSISLYYFSTGFFNKIQNSQELFIKKIFTSFFTFSIFHIFFMYINFLIYKEEELILKGVFNNYGIVKNKFKNLNQEFLTSYIVGLRKYLLQSVLPNSVALVVLETMNLL